MNIRLYYCTFYISATLLHFLKLNFLINEIKYSIYKSDKNLLKIAKFFGFVRINKSHYCGSLKIKV